MKFGTYRLIVLDPQQLSFEKMASSVFHSTNLTTNGSRQFFWWLSETPVPGHEVSEGIDR